MVQPVKTDKELLMELARGNEESFECLFGRYHERLFKYISLFIKSPQIAEEVVMDVFMKIWSAKELIGQVENFDSFLFRVAHNKAIDFLRMVSKKPDFKELMWDTMQLSAPDETDALLLKAEFEGKVRHALSLLSEQRRKVFEMSREQDLSHEQIASRLGLSKHTVNNHIVESKRFIRSYLSKNLDIAWFIVFYMCNEAIYSLF
jgi:RNA polymerase sigma-70 factor (ECF subfamily)